MPACEHSDLWFEPSEHAASVGYKRPTPQERADATQLDGSPSADQLNVKPSTFPGPLVLPGDELSFNPRYKRQDGKSWSRCTGFYTAKRRVVYVVPTPRLSPGIDEWLPKPNLKSVETAGRKQAAGASTIAPPKTDDVLDYLSAFYHGMQVKLLEKPALSLVRWEIPPWSEDRSPRVGLSISGEVVGVRVRPSPDGMFDAQLNLDDILDAAISVLPKDAHALLMVVDHDLYEDEEDDFCCGRAYGGSRVAVVSTARYNPALDAQQEIETEHAWPASHCKEFVDANCRESELKPSRRPKCTKRDWSKSAMHSAVDAMKGIPKRKTPAKLCDLWLGRVCKTASHELGHCFGMGHCVYYACVMQGTSGLTEDAGQPPYLCPVDLAKLFRVTHSHEKAHQTALLAFCERFQNDRLFAAFAAWLKIRLAELEDVDTPKGGSETDAIVVD